MDNPLSPNSQELESVRLALVGQLFPGIYHEFSNALQTLRGVIFLAKQAPGDPALALSNLQLAEREIERLAVLLGQAHLVCSPQDRAQAITIERLLDALKGLLRHDLKQRKITLVDRPAANLPPVLGVADYLLMALVEIALYFIHTVESSTRLEVATRQADGRIQVLWSATVASPDHDTPLPASLSVAKQLLAIQNADLICSREAGTFQVMASLPVAQEVEDAESPNSDR